MYVRPVSSRSIFWTIKIATVFDSSDPVSMMRKQSGMISVESKKWITVLLSFCYGMSEEAAPLRKSLTFTNAPITPKDVSRRYSNGRVLEVVLRKGYKKSGICALLRKLITALERLKHRDRTHHSEKADVSRDGTRRTAAAQAHCIHDLKRER